MVSSWYAMMIKLHVCSSVPSVLLPVPSSSTPFAPTISVMCTLVKVIVIFFRLGQICKICKNACDPIQSQGTAVGSNSFIKRNSIKLSQSFNHTRRSGSVYATLFNSNLRNDCWQANNMQNLANVFVTDGNLSRSWCKILELGSWHVL